MADKKSNSKILSYLRSNEFISLLIILFIVASAHLFFCAVTGKNFSSGSYSSYYYQAQSWLSGRLDIDNRQWLELAIYEGKYYVSFPPLPSVLMLPLIPIFGEMADAVLAVLSLAVGVIFSFRLTQKIGLGSLAGILLTSLLYIGTNMWQITVDSWVWFIAQNLSFTFSIISIYCAVRNHKGLSMLSLACAVGCRPFQIVILPLALYLLIKNDSSSESLIKKFIKLVFNRIYVYLPALIVVCFYMWLNYTRFGNILEFGHNYLPEFLRSDKGQFSLSYAAENFASLFRLPEIKEGTIYFSMFNGNCIFIVIPLFALYPVSLAAEYVSHGRIKDAFPQLMSIVLIALQIFLLLCHRTMGGAHFGHRYIMDTVPILFFISCLTFRNCENSKKCRIFLSSVCVILMCLGFVINFCGTAEFYGTDLSLIALQ